MTLWLKSGGSVKQVRHSGKMPLMTWGNFPRHGLLTILKHLEFGTDFARLPQLD